MKQKSFLILILLIVLNGCGLTQSTVRSDNNVQNENIIKDKNNETNSLFDSKNEVNFLEYKEPKIDKNKYVFPNKKFTSNANGVPFIDIIHEIGTVTNMNIVFDDDINRDKVISINFEDVLVKDALDMIMKSTKYYYEVNGNIINVKKFKKQIFNINYLSSTNTFSSKLGGDIFGGVSDKNGIKGDFTLEAEQDKTVNNFYQQLEKTIKDFISKEGKFNINAKTGVVVVEDFKENVEQVEKIIEANKKTLGKQILIEAKILEVSLTKDYQTGIEWSSIFNNPLNLGGAINIGQTLNLSGSSITNATLQYTNKNFNALISAISNNGSVKTLSNPRIMVMNGQSALITSGKIVPYWEKQVTSLATTSSTTTSNSEVTYNRRDVLDGISLGVTPIINVDEDIILNVVPILTSIENDKTYIDNGSVVASAPILNIKNLGTVIKTRDNNMVVIGGLISEKVAVKNNGVPGLNETPIVGDVLFNSKVDGSEKRELVIILRIKVL